MSVRIFLQRAAALLLANAAVPFGAAHADLVLGQLIVDLTPGKQSRQDVEVWNNSSDRTYVAVEASEILAPGTPAESRRQDPDPEKLGLLVSPARMILEPGERKLVRIAEIAAPPQRERDYRVTVKPVVGPLSSAKSGLKILVGYDVLVMVRPAQPQADVTFSRSADKATFRNDGNVSVELIEGRQCDSAGGNCAELRSKRLYPGAQWSEDLKPGYRAEYTLKSPGQSVRKTF
jgi:P pilus assembly chaperone PapD